MQAMRNLVFAAIIPQGGLERPAPCRWGSHRAPISSQPHHKSTHRRVPIAEERPRATPRVRRLRNTARALAACLVSSSLVASVPRVFHQQQPASQRSPAQHVGARREDVAAGCVVVRNCVVCLALVACLLLVCPTATAPRPAGRSHPQPSHLHLSHHHHNSPHPLPGQGHAAPRGTHAL